MPPEKSTAGFQPTWITERGLEQAWPRVRHPRNMLGGPTEMPSLQPTQFWVVIHCRSPRSCMSAWPQDLAGIEHNFQRLRMKTEGERVRWYDIVLDGERNGS